MEESVKEKPKNQKNSKILQVLYDFIEQSHSDSICFQFLGLYFYFFQMTSYSYSFSINEIQDRSAQFIYFFHYYMNLPNILHYLKSYQFTIFVFLLCFIINLIIIMNVIFQLLFMRPTSRKMNKFERFISELSNLYLWHLMFFSIEVFMIGFKITEETDYFINSYNFSHSLKVIGIIGISMSLLNGSVLIYFNNDYNFLDKSKLRLNFGIKTIFCFLIRLIQLILYNTGRNSELISFFMIYCFLLVNLLAYLTDLPFKNKTLSIFFICLLCYSFLNILILTMFRKNFLIAEFDLFPINLILIILVFKLSKKKYYFLYYYYYIVYENKKKNIPLFVLEEIIDLSQSSERKEKEVFLLLGYFAHHPKYCFNSFCNRKVKNIIPLEHYGEKIEIDKTFIFQFIYRNFKDLIEKEKKNQKNPERFELLIAKFLSFLLKFSENSVLSFFEFQKILYIQSRFSTYFSVFSFSLSQSVKARLKIYLKNQELNVLDSKKKITYKEFFNIVKIQQKLENNFQSIVRKKIMILKNTLLGVFDYKKLFFSNLSLSALIEKFKKKLKPLNENSVQIILKHKFSFLLNSLILNKNTEAKLNEKKLAEYFTSKDGDLVDKSFLYDLVGDDTVVCQASFIDQKGKILKESKSTKFMSFFGYCNKDKEKITQVLDLMPNFIGNFHEKAVLNYIEQKNILRQSNFMSFAINQEKFVFPVYISISVNYSQTNDFVLFSALTKANEFSSKFCLFTMSGYILEVSKDFFHDIGQKYNFLTRNDINYINIFHLIPDFYSNINYLASLGASKSNNYKLYFPKDMKTLIEKNKQRSLVFKNKSDVSKNTQETCFNNYTFKNISLFENVNYKNEKQYGEVIFDLTPMHHGHDSSSIKFFMLSIKKYKKQDFPIENQVFTLLHPLNNQPDSERNLPVGNSFRNTIEKKEEISELNLLFNQKSPHKQNFKSPILYSGKQIYFEGEKKNSEVDKNNLMKNSFHLSCTSSEHKSNIAFFTKLKFLSKVYPRPLKISIFLLILQILFSSTFTLLYFTFSANYLNNYFKPIQIFVHEFSLQYHFTGDLMSSNIKNEYFYLNMINITARPEYTLFLGLIYNKSSNQVKKINDRFRNQLLGLEFENIYRKTLINFYEGSSFQIKRALYIDFIDIVSNYMNTHLPLLIAFNENSICNYSEFLFLIRNFPSFLTKNSFLYLKLMSEFSASDKEINTLFFEILIIFMFFCIMIKIYESFQWYCFMNIIKNLLKMYLHINEEELTIEINSLKNFLELIQDSSRKYINDNASEIIKNKKMRKTEISNEIKTNFKNGRNTLFFRSQGFSKKLLFLYFNFCSFLILLYFIFSYSNWIDVDRYIVRLTNTNTLFSRTYLYSSSIAFLEDLLYREKLIQNPEFEKLNDSMQSQQSRIQFAKNALDIRMGWIANTSAMNIILDGIDDDRKSPQMNHLLKGNLCELLEYNFTEQQKLICESLLNGAFKKGLGNSITEMFKSIKSRETTLQYDPQGNKDQEKQQERIQEYIKSKDYFEMYLSELFLHDILEKFYTINGEFYNDYLDTEFQGFYAFLFICLSFMIVLNIFFIYFIQKKIRLIYSSTCKILFLIPADKILKDDQMINFLKRISNQMS